MKKVLSFVLVLIVIALIATVAVLSVRLTRSAATSISSSAYTIGMIDEKGRAVEDDGSIYTKKGISTEGFKITIDKKSDIEYRVFFYDKNDEFISATEPLTTDFNGEVPENAITFKVMITPTADKDGKVSKAELKDYAGQLNVVVDK